MFSWVLSAMALSSFYLYQRLIIKSLSATATESVSANPVTVVIAIPVENGMPLVNSTFAPEVGGITIEKNTEAPAVGAAAVLWKTSLRAAAFELYMNQPPN